MDLLEILRFYLVLLNKTMNLSQIRKKVAYNASASPTQKQATRTWLASLHKQYPVAITLTLKQSLLVKNANGAYYKKIDKNEIRRVATHFTHKLNKQYFGCRAKKYGEGLKYLIVVEGERTHKHLHLHMAVGGFANDIKWNEVEDKVRKAKLSVEALDEQHKVDIVDSGWMEYLTKELGMNDTDNVLWDLA